MKKPIVVEGPSKAALKPSKKVSKRFEPKPCLIADHILYCSVKSCVEAGACTYRSQKDR